MLDRRGHCFSLWHTDGQAVRKDGMLLRKIIEYRSVKQPKWEVACILTQISFLLLTSPGSSGLVHRLWERKVTNGGFWYSPMNLEQIQRAPILLLRGLFRIFHKLKFFVIRFSLPTYMLVESTFFSLRGP